MNPDNEIDTINFFCNEKDPNFQNPNGRKSIRVLKTHITTINKQGKPS